MDVRHVGGKANTPQVISSEGHAHVHAWTERPISLASWKGEAFTVLTEHTVLAANTAEIVMWLRNDKSWPAKGSAQSLVISKINISSELGSHVEVFLDPLYTSGGRDVTPVMLYVGRTPTRSVTLKDSKTSPLILDIMGATEIRSVFVQARGNLEIDFSDALLLADGRSIMVRVDGPLADRLRVAVDCYWASEPE